MASAAIVSRGLEHLFEQQRIMLIKATKAVELLGKNESSC